MRPGWVIAGRGSPPVARVVARATGSAAGSRGRPGFPAVGNSQNVAERQQRYGTPAAGGAGGKASCCRADRCDGMACPAGCQHPISPEAVSAPGPEPGGAGPGHSDRGASVPPGRVVSSGRIRRVAARQDRRRMPRPNRGGTVVTCVAAVPGSVRSSCRRRRFRAGSSGHSGPGPPSGALRRAMADLWCWGTNQQRSLHRRRGAGRDVPGSRRKRQAICAQGVHGPAAGPQTESATPCKARDCASADLAPAVGLEPTTWWLTATRSAS